MYTFFGIWPSQNDLPSSAKDNRSSAHARHLTASPSVWKHYTVSLLTPVYKLVIPHFAGEHEAPVVNWVITASPHTMKSRPDPSAETLFSVSSAWPKSKDTADEHWQSRKDRPAIFKQGRWDRHAKPHWRCFCWLSITSFGRLSLLDCDFIPYP